MSEAPVGKKAGFPIGLTIATAIAFIILCGLGGWQLKRLAWKQDLLARIETLKTAPARPLNAVLADAAKGRDVAWVRVATTCAPLVSQPLPLVYGVRDGDVVWRATAPCFLSEVGPYDLILLDRGVAPDLTGQVAPAPRAFSVPQTVTGVLTPIAQLGGDRAKVLQRFPNRKPAAFVLMVETENPPPAGVVPTPLPAEFTNRHLEYALTWFGLAVTLLVIYAAMLRRRS